MKKLLSVSVLGAVLALGLSGCGAVSLKIGDDEAVKSTPDKVEIEVDSSSEGKDIEKKESSKAGSSEGVVVTFTGQGLEKGADGSYPKFPVEIGVSISDIAPVSDSERAELMSIANASQEIQLDAFDMYKIFVSESYISGDDPIYQASYTSYKPVNAEGVVLGELPVIGFDWCKSSSFGAGFVSGEAHVSCVLALVSKGGPAPAGVQFSQFGTPSADSPVIIKQ